MGKRYERQHVGMWQWSTKKKTCSHSFSLNIFGRRHISPHGKVCTFPWDIFSLLPKFGQHVLVSALRYLQVVNTPAVNSHDYDTSLEKIETVESFWPRAVAVTIG